MHPFSIQKLFVIPVLFSGINNGIAQDNLVNLLQYNLSANSKNSFQFTEIINMPNSSVKNQGASGTCWSYAVNSFLESEMIKKGKEPIALSEIFSARNAYVEKGRNYVRMHGAITLGDGGSLHDVINIYRKYGTLPREVYTGLNYGTDTNQFAEMGALIQGILEAVVKNPNGELTPNWEKAYTAVIDSYLGEVPKSFDYKGRKYTPQSFAKEIVGLDADDYVEISSLMEHPYYTKFTLMVPDNWSMDQVYNVKMNELTAIVDHALKNGYTIAWSTDISEKGFSWKNGIAFVPEKDFSKMTFAEKENMFNGPKTEPEITEEMRQKAFDNYLTTDDHGMHIVGLAKDQNDKEYYIVKNSWGVTNDYEGYLYVSKNFVQLKTIALLLNKNALPASIRKKLSL